MHDRYPRFAGKYGGGGNRTRVGVTPETVALQELRWICEDAWHAEQDFLCSLAAEVGANRSALGEGSETQLYVVFDGTAAKFGLADNPIARAGNLQVANPRQLILYTAVPSTRALEVELHRLISPWRIRGEWFDISPPVLALADTLLGIQQMCRDMEATGMGAFAEDTISMLALDVLLEGIAA